MKHIVNSANRRGRMASVLMPSLVLGVALVSCNVPYPLSLLGQKPGGGNTTAPVLATEQGALSATEGSSGKPNMDCQKDGPWYLNVDENYSMTVGNSNANIKVEGYVSLLMDKAGNVSAGATQALGDFELTSTNCHFYATWKYVPQITGTCRGGVMKLSVVENMGENGVIQGPNICRNGEEQWTFPVPGTMKHDLTIPLNTKAGGGWVKIPWGILGNPGYKSWEVSNAPDLVPLEPLVSPVP
ncbi:MAG: hypothetical protein ABSC61_10590 [Anaerolineales bacterium]